MNKSFGQMVSGPGRAAVLIALWAGYSLFSNSAFAATITLDALDSGFVTEAGGSAKGDGAFPTTATYNYSVGYEVHYDAGFYSIGTSPMERKNYFLFDLAGITDPIVSATLLLNAGTFEGSLVPGADLFETFVVGETTDPGGAVGLIFDLATFFGVGSTAFDDAADPAIGVAADLFLKLADGAALATIDIDASDDDDTLAIPISPGGLGYLNAFLGGPLVLGGKVATISPADGTPQQPFGFTDFDVPGGDPLGPKLMITTVPEPSTTLLASFASISLSVSGRRRRR